VIVQDAAAACSPGTTDKSIPVNVTLHPAEQVTGIPLTRYVTESQPADLNDGTSHQFNLEVPAGRYDMYIVGDADQMEEAGDCDLPPILLPGHELQQKRIPVHVTLESSEQLTGVIQLPNDTEWSLDGWQIELVENENGRRISTSQILPEQQAYVLEAKFSLQYWPELLEQQQDALIKLSPPADKNAMPTILWNLAAVDLHSLGHVGLDISELGSAQPLEIEASVLDSSQTNGIPATVTVQSLELLDGKFGTNISLKTTTETDATGRFTAWLLPGTYEVIAQPGDGIHAITAATWTFTEGDLGGGRTITVNPKAALLGAANTPQGTAAYDISAYVQPSASPAASYYYDKLTTSDLLPANAVTLTNANGAFAISLDPGVFDLSLRPEREAGYPWLVRSRVTILEYEEPNIANLGQLTISNPVVLTGTVKAQSNGPLAAAVIRAWLPVYVDGGSNDQQVPTMIQIGEAVSNGSGGYSLYLPSSLSQ